MFGVLTADPSTSPSITSPGASPSSGSSPSPPATSDSVSALPNWLLVALLLLVTGVIVAAFALTFYNLSSPRSTLKNLLGLRRSTRFRPEAIPAAQDRADLNYLVGPSLIRTLGMDARVSRRTTRTTLAITGFSMLGIVVVAAFGVSGQGVRDLRSQAVAAVITLVAAIAGFYFGSESAAKAAPAPGDGAKGSPTTPLAFGPDPVDEHGNFTIGAAGHYTPTLSGTSPITVSATGRPLPAGLRLDPATGTISGTPEANTAGTYDVVLTASNAAEQATLHVRLTVAA